MATKHVEYSATGRRKNAAAHVRLRPGEGKVLVNDREFADYFPLETLRDFAMQPLKTVEQFGKYDVVVVAKGGGLGGQAGAVRHGLARALCTIDPNFRGALKKAGYLMRDPRMKERKKSGQPGARKRFQFSKR